jgi:catechol 2,3-dioxygenase-like lactoylglutathione lyase family enzyme
VVRAGTLVAMTGQREEAGDLRLRAVVINVRDMDAGVRFWCAALGYVPRDREPDPTFVALVDPAGRGLQVSLQLSEAPPRSPAQVHMDLFTGDRAGQVERLIGLGATRAEDWVYPDDADFVVLRDPDGNEFCVVDHPGS